MIHSFHPDVHDAGLADDCEGCAEVAAAPSRNMDDRLLRQMVEFAVDRDRMFKCRSITEAEATARVLTTLEQVGRLCEVAGDHVAAYLRDRWHLDANIEPRRAA